MTNACRLIEQWLDEAPDAPPLARDLEAHAAACETCARRLAIDRTLRERLAAGATLEPAHRADLVARVLAANAPAARRPRRLPRWSWAPVAAAAAVVLALVVFQPMKRPPILPTEVFGYFLGPIADMFPPPSPEPAQPAQPVQTEEDVPTMETIFGAFWTDLEGPLTVVLGAMEAPRAAAAQEPAAAKQ
jgi:hypothetical protein